MRSEKGQMRLPRRGYCGDRRDKQGATRQRLGGRCRQRCRGRRNGCRAGRCHEEEKVGENLASLDSRGAWSGERT
ncbi:hypothetical protein VNO78_34308 [Psophocarpus tetragonolobus]|uniref:Uncharacterized protein n=1 Tax=Psophocarpus tetragonolobus TaxID=3891 RepID=A0AAN9RS17_PSOTE